MRTYHCNAAPPRDTPYRPEEGFAFYIFLTIGGEPGDNRYSSRSLAGRWARLVTNPQVPPFGVVEDPPRTYSILA